MLHLLLKAKWKHITRTRDSHVNATVARWNRGAYGGEGLGDFGESVRELTMFADYRVPVVLRGLGVLRYSHSLAGTVARREPIPAGSLRELEIRSCTVQAVERLRHAIATRETKCGPGHEGEGRETRGEVTSVALDWLLWTKGESARDTEMHKLHHRTLTVFY